MYGKLSLYSKTKIIDSQYLDIFEPITVPRARDDVLWEITPEYTYRPDLLSFDVYGNKDLWWVFAQRNPDILKDPIYDFVPGTQIYLPQAKYLRQYLGN
jgi:hypothetical protein